MTDKETHTVKHISWKNKLTDEREQDVTIEVSLVCWLWHKKSSKLSFDNPGSDSYFRCPNCKFFFEK